MTIYYAQDKQRWRVELRYNNRRITRLLPSSLSETQARAVHERMRADLFLADKLPDKEPGWEQEVERAIADSQSWFYRALARAKNRSKARPDYFSLPIDALRTICLRSGGRCEVTGIRFSDERVQGTKMRPFSRALIASTQGSDTAWKIAD